MTRAPAPAKLNLALVVGPPREDGRHEVTSVMQRIDVCDRVAVAPAGGTSRFPQTPSTGPLRGQAASPPVRGFPADTLVRDALDAFASATGAERGWRARIWKRIPVAAGLGGGSSDAATALRLANATLARPLAHDRLVSLARGLGADVPFFLEPGPQLAEGDGSSLTPLDLPQDYWVVLVLPRGARKESTAAVYAAFDRRAGKRGHEARREALLAALARIRRPRDLAALPANDLASSPVADDLRAAGAFRADVTGAGPVVYGLFHRRAHAEAARRALSRRGRTWLTVPAWYG